MMPQLSLYAKIRAGLIKVSLLSPAEHRFWNHVNKNGPIHPVYGQCWMWTASKSHNGYGQIVVKGKGRRAHAYSYELQVGKIPVGHYVLHKCDTPACVNPKHLFTGTTRTNQQDKVNKNRQAKGESNAGSVLTEAQIQEIRRRYSLRSNNYHDPINGQNALAKEFGVTQANISIIVRSVGWKHVK